MSTGVRPGGLPWQRTPWDLARTWAPAYTSLTFCTASRVGSASFLRAGLTVACGGQERQGAPMAIVKVATQTVHSRIICSPTRSVVILAMSVALLTICLFPSVQGPYSVVHGPATAFRAARSAGIAQASIMHSAMHLAANYAGCQLPVALQTSPSKAEPCLEMIQQGNMTLRC